MSAVPVMFPVEHSGPRVEFVPFWKIAERWADVAPHLARPLARQSALTLETLKASLIRGEMMLWEVRGEMAMVTQLQVFPAERICTIVLCGGTNLNRWKRAALREVAAYAKASGCTGLQIVGRRGWTRAVPEFQPTGEVVLRASL
jgi:hypothetical protein